MTRVKLNKFPTYRISVNRQHLSGIGTVFIKHINSYLKPNWDNCDFFDVTNGEWALYLGSRNHNQHVSFQQVMESK